MIYVKKLKGTLQKYNPNKLVISLEKSGADKETIDRIMNKVDGILYDGIETKKLFRFVIKELKKNQPYVASKYNLKNSILRLGIEGSHFERYVSFILKKLGYSTKLNCIVKGKYINHEIDIIATNEKKVMVECKHHIRPWIGCNIQTALYVYARFLDVKKKFNCPMLVTNTRFSRQVIAYSNGVNMKLMGWKYPNGDSLEYNIEKFKLYPITMLNLINKKKVNILLSSNILLISELLSKDAGSISDMLMINKTKSNKILEEARVLCKCD